jgi:hypothetical protein
MMLVRLVFIVVLEPFMVMVFNPLMIVADPPVTIVPCMMVIIVTIDYRGTAVGGTIVATTTVVATTRRVAVLKTGLRAERYQREQAKLNEQ